MRHRDATPRLTRGVPARVVYRRTRPVLTGFDVSNCRNSRERTRRITTDNLYSTVVSTAFRLARDHATPQRRVNRPRRGDPAFVASRERARGGHDSSAPSAPGTTTTRPTPRSSPRSNTPAAVVTAASGPARGSTTASRNPREGADLVRASRPAAR